MLLHKVTERTILEGSAGGSEFFIADDPAVHRQVGALLREMYSEVPWALIREYSANGIDANTAAGRADTPIDITLPTQQSSELVMRDYGDGLDFTALKFMLTGYGNTDKRGRRTQIGGFGIGAKCGLAYTDSMTFESVYMVNGKKWRTVMMCFLDDEHLARSKFLSHKLVTTDVSTGITVKIPVAKNDCDRFREAVLRFRASPEIAARIRCPGLSEGKTPEHILKPLDIWHTSIVNVGKFTVKVHVQDATGSGYSNAVDKCIVLISGIPYKCNLASVFETAKRWPWGNCGGFDHKAPFLILDFPPEAGVTPTPSREDITITPKAAALIVNAIDAMARDVSPAAAWRAAKNPDTKMTLSKDVALAWTLAGFRMSPPAKEGKTAQKSQTDWIDKTELPAVRVLLDSKRWSLNSSGSIGFVAPVGWIMFRRKGAKGYKLIPENRNRDYSASTKFYPSRLSLVPAKTLDKYTEKGADADCATLLIPPRLRAHFRGLPYGGNWNNDNEHVICVEDPSIASTKREDLDGMTLADETQDIFSWKPLPKQPRVYVKDPSAPKGKRLVPKETIDYYVISVRDYVETPGLHLNNAKYGTSTTDVGWNWRLGTDVEEQQRMAAKLIGKKPLATTGYVIKNVIPSHLTDAKRQRLLWPKFVEAAKLYVDGRPKPVQDWLRARSQAYTINGMLDHSFIRAVTEPKRKDSLGVPVNAELKELLWLITPPAVAEGQNGVNHMDAWLGTAFGSGSTHIWPSIIYDNGDDKPNVIRESPKSCSDMGKLLAALIKQQHPFIEMMGMHSNTYRNGNGIDSTLAAGITKYSGHAFNFTKLWQFVQLYK